ncbi:hypothetical protein P3T76_015032 [Phytophthora citrophthora]|uniref:Uncharacterized protein n=1 Tax=Phytophthora citrophthora TaxID=4793 RepID=A0AAD9G034_9STRA|nr:hypothetical protein P3T76_015032 [Phytophthora citrophthora]
MAECYVTEAESASFSASTSASTYWGDDTVGEGDDGDDPIFNPMDAGGNGNGNGNANGNGNGKGCTEEALWCSSLGQALSRDPTKNCEFPPCPYYGLRRR